MREIHFNKIKVSGFRGRNFTLNINPRGQHTVFVMDGNTGKTTTIELLRWCFRHPQNKSVDKFEHMWNKPAHILDDTKKGMQECEIEIQFDAKDEEDEFRNYKFIRNVIGEFNENYPLVGDKMQEVSDVLEIDNGVEVIRGNKVFDYLSRNFRFDNCAEYFCFDGEKAREVMQLAADKGKIHTLLDLVNRRATHPQLEQFENRLNDLRHRVHREAKSKVTDRALENNFNRIRILSNDETVFRGLITEYNDKISTVDAVISRLEKDVDEIEDEIDKSRIENLIKRKELETNQERINVQIRNNRINIYKNMSNWVQTEYYDKINEIKNILKETGKLPEPYREDLISICLEREICQICGRDLDPISKKHVLDLSRLIASHKVQEFLSSTFSIKQTKFDPRETDAEINYLVDEYNDLQIKINEIKLSDAEQRLIDERTFKLGQLAIHRKDRDDLLVEKSRYEDALQETMRELKECQEKNEALKEYRIILDRIETSKEIIREAADKIRIKAIEIIGEVISEGVTSILGDNFSAKLTVEKGLLLGENGFFGKEKGGYSGRLILSYCFAEAMTLVDPIIVDTPVGNIGTHRRLLAEHLFENHKQVILLCLPTELENFSDILSDNPIYIENEVK